jgi:hypothetical protein
MTGEAASVGRERSTARMVATSTRTIGGVTYKRGITRVAEDHELAATGMFAPIESPEGRSAIRGAEAEWNLASTRERRGSWAL